MRTLELQLAEKLDALSSGVVSMPDWKVLLIKVPKPWDLVIFGAGDDSIPLVRYAADSGFRVYVVDHRSAYLTAERFPDAEALVPARYDGDFPLAIGPATLAVVKTRLFEHDRGWVRRLVQHSPRYIGLLGPAHRRDRICEGLDEAIRRRIYGPVGLDIGATGPEQIAVSIVAELLATLTGSPGGHARDKKGRLHDRRKSEMS